ncbi:hypothetical protein GIB67_004861 [Kingdonia uniflora]|uniref:Ribosomal protein L18 n=1 Tax=Kingdonia uniflora TaxID=39325 RepID=A0A7J7LNR5_9MAGN|nr:hypothetical protein GIB67_004861 [Kingdonia uniflora]
MTVDEYANEFYLFSSRVATLETEAHKVSRFKSRLTRKIQDELTMVNIYSVAEVEMVWRIELLREGLGATIVVKTAIPATTSVPTYPTPTTTAGTCPMGNSSWVQCFGCDHCCQIVNRKVYFSLDGGSSSMPSYFLSVMLAFFLAIFGALLRVQFHCYLRGFIAGSSVGWSFRLLNYEKKENTHLGYGPFAAAYWEWISVTVPRSNTMQNKFNVLMSLRHGLFKSTTGFISQTRTRVSAMVKYPPFRPERIVEFLKPYALKMHFTNKYISAQVIHLPTATVASSASSQEKVLRTSMETTRDVAAAAQIGKILGERLLLKDIPAVSVILKKEQKYHGKVKAVVDSLREAGVKLI